MKTKVHVLPHYPLSYMCTYFAQKSVNGIASKSSFAEELHFISKNSSCKQAGRMLSPSILEARCLGNSVRITVSKAEGGLPLHS